MWLKTHITSIKTASPSLQMTDNSDRPTPKTCQLKMLAFFFLSFLPLPSLGCWHERHNRGIFKFGTFVYVCGISSPFTTKELHNWKHYHFLFVCVCCLRHLILYSFTDRGWTQSWRRGAPSPPLPNEEVDTWSVQCMEKPTSATFLSKKINLF